MFQPPPAVIQQRRVCFHAFSCLSHMFLMLAASWSCCLPRDTCRGHLWCARPSIRTRRTQRLYQYGPLGLALPAPRLCYTSQISHQELRFLSALGFKRNVVKTHSEVMWKLKVILRPGFRLFWVCPSSDVANKTTVFVTVWGFFYLFIFLTILSASQKTSTINCIFQLKKKY